MQITVDIHCCFCELRLWKFMTCKRPRKRKPYSLDDLFRESVPHHNNLKVWKAAPLETDTLKGIADYLITPKHAYIETPLLCVAEAKKDDFVKGAAHRLSQKGNAHKTFISKSSG